MHKLILSIALLAVGMTAGAQTLEKMRWFNEPESYVIRDGVLEMDVPAQCDYWRVAHYGFTVDDGPFLYADYGGEFEATVKVFGDYKTRFDQAGMMIRIDKENWVKFGIEYFEGLFNVSTVVTHGTSDWSVVRLDRPVDHLWLKAVRRGDAIEAYYSLDGNEYVMVRTFWMQRDTPVQIGLVAACPDGNGFRAKFSDFKVRHLPDAVRLEWLKNNEE